MLSENVESALHDTAVTKPDVLILSTESAFRYSLEGHRKLAQILFNLTNHVQVFVWLRHPIPFYRAHAHQRSKPLGNPDTDRSVATPEQFSARLRRRVTNLRRAWGTDRVTLRYYDKEHLVDGDVVLDFIAHALPEARGLVLEDTTLNSTSAPPLTEATVAALRRSCADDIAFLEEEGLLERGPA